jgi:Fe2+ or Zn2+ uptake regulation protein
MAWRISWHLLCDHCGKKATFAGSPSSAVEKKARRYGWAFTVDAWGLFRHLCPACGKVPETRAMYERAKA